MTSSARLRTDVFVGAGMLLAGVIASIGGAACTATRASTVDPGASAVPTMTPPAAAATGGLLPAQRAELEAALAPLGSLGTGASLAVIDGDHSATFVTGVESAGGPPVDSSTRFNTMSVSKLMTAARIVSLAHEGRVRLGQPIAEILRGVHLLDELGRDRASEVTLELLLAHRAGLQHQPGDQLDLDRAKTSWGDPDLLAKITADWPLRLARAPGTYGYSNMGYTLLGAAVEKVEGCRFAACMNDFTAALDLREMTFSPSTLTEHAAHGHAGAGDDRQAHPPGWYQSAYSAPFSGLWSSMPDLARFGRMLADAVADPSAPMHALVAPRAQGHGIGLPRGERMGLVTLEHDGGGPGFLAWLVIVPERRLVLAVACNGSDESAAVIETFAAAQRALFAALVGSPG